MDSRLALDINQTISISSTLLAPKQRASDGDEFEGFGRGSSRLTDQHGQTGVDVQESRSMERGPRPGGPIDKGEKEDARRGASRHID
jgi:hypothetical protein